MCRIRRIQEYTYEELDNRRREVIPEVRTALQNYLSGSSPLEELKTRNVSINKRNRLP
jgi:hypothetical protein